MLFKNEEGGQAEMCKIMDEIRQEGIDLGFDRGMECGMERGMECGMERGAENKLLETLRTIMRKMRLSEEEALAMLDVPQDRWQKYKALLEH